MRTKRREKTMIKQQKKERKDMNQVESECCVSKKQETKMDKGKIKKDSSNGRRGMCIQSIIWFQKRS